MRQSFELYEDLTVSVHLSLSLCVEALPFSSEAETITLAAINNIFLQLGPGLPCLLMICRDFNGLNLER